MGDAVSRPSFFNPEKIIKETIMFLRKYKNSIIKLYSFFVVVVWIHGANFYDFFNLPVFSNCYLFLLWSFCLRADKPRAIDATMQGCPAIRNSMAFGRSRCLVNNSVWCIVRMVLENFFSRSLENCASPCKVLIFFLFLSSFFLFRKKLWNYRCFLVSPLLFFNL